MKNIIGQCSECGDKAVRWVDVVSGLCPHHKELRIEQNKSLKKKIKKPVRIKPMSDSRKKDHALYLKNREEFLKDNPKCAVYTHLNSTEIHHAKGRVGKLLYEKSNFKAVSREGHLFIEAHPEWALNHGFRELRTK